MNTAQLARTVRQDHNGFFGGDELQQFEKTTRTSTRRSHADQEAYRARKGKRNKHERGDDRWDDLGATKEYAEKVHVKSIDHFPVGVPRWAL